MIRTYPKPEPIEPPIWFATDLWFAFLFIFGMLTILAVSGFIMIDGGKLNNCADMKASQEWINLCNQVNNEIYTLFIVMGTITTISLIMYCISKQQSNRSEKQ